MKLIPQWRRWWRMNSVQVFGVLALAPVLWAALPPETKATIPPSWLPWIISGLGLIGAILRLRDQGIK